MEEKTIVLTISGLLPGIENDHDACIFRLETTLQNHKGICRAHRTPEETSGDLCLHYDPDQVTDEEVRKLAQKAATGITNRYHHHRMSIEGMDCSDCAVVIEHGLSRMEGVLNARVNYSLQCLNVEYDKHQTSQRAIEKKIRQLGYDVAPGKFRKWYTANSELLFSLASGLMLLTGWLLAHFANVSLQLSLPFYLAAYLLGGYEPVYHAWHSLRKKEFDTDLLMVLAALGAASLGDYAEGALLLFLFSLGHTLEHRALDRARNAVRALADLTPKTALVRRPDMNVTLAVENLSLDDIVIVRPGERVPVDGVVSAGNSGVDQSPVTGESIPVAKQSGDQVFAGSINGNGALDLRVNRLAKDSTLARVMKMVEQAQAQKSPTQQITEKFTSIFVPVILLLDLALIVVPPLLGVPFSESFLRAMTLLVATSPCALALGTPAAILAGVAQAARSGVLIKGGAHLENLGRVQAIAFDKTGTLTQGKPQVTDIIALQGRDEVDILRLAAAVESQSSHPLALAVANSARDRELALPEIAQVKSLTGMGIQADWNGEQILVGSLKLFESNQILVPEALMERLGVFEAQGKTMLLLGLSGEVIGLIALADVIRPNAAAAVKRLQQLGIGKTIMLSGDNSRTAAAIAGEIGIDNFQAELMPEDKLDAVRSLVKDHEIIAMVGDGINDAPALAHASVGIAMGGAGTDAALESADVALMSSDLGQLPFAIGLGRAARRIIRQNLVIAISVIVILAALGLAGAAGIGIAIIIHEGSTLVVVLNALRLLSFRQQVMVS
jgi:Cd2+/Zn2+-exporting ATPase